jgi:2-methylisocitrate lyase-like PEP mutase family enzyme
VDIVLRVIAAGAVGVNIEDLVPGMQKLEPLPLQCEKISAVADAARKSGVRVVINARTDVCLAAIGPAGERIGTAIERGRAFLAAGADCAFVPGVRDAADIGALVKGIEGPINILAVKGTPSIPELQALGVARVSVGSGPMRATLALTRDIARELKSQGTFSAFTERALLYDEVNELMR